VGKKESRISSFKDPSIQTSVPVIDIVDSIKPGFIKYDLVIIAPPSEKLSYWLALLWHPVAAARI